MGIHVVPKVSMVMGVMIFFFRRVKYQSEKAHWINTPIGLEVWSRPSSHARRGSCVTRGVSSRFEAVFGDGHAHSRRLAIKYHKMSGAQDHRLLVYIYIYDYIYIETCVLYHVRRYADTCVCVCVDVFWVEQTRSRLTCCCRIQTLTAVAG